MVSLRAKRVPALENEIISTVSKPIPTKDLLVRLQNIADELSAVGQNDSSNYPEIAQKLANKKLIASKNVGIQALTCCALSDILRIYAPEAPFTPAELSTIFKAFFAQLGHLWDTENAYFLQQSYLLKQLVEVKSFILISDLPDAPQLITNLAETMYELANKGFPLKLELLASEMLAEVIAEAEVVPQKVVNMVLKRLTTSAGSLTTNASNISNPGFAFSLAVCETNVDKMSRQVAQLFSEMLDESAQGDDYSASYQALEKIHLWSIQIWHHVPDLLASVMGLINDELNSDSEKIRVLATSTIGAMIAAPNMDSSAAHFVTAHKSTWTNWIQKTLDVSPAVRAKWVEQVPDILASMVTTEMASELCNGLSKCLVDTNEKARFAACKAIERIPFTTFTNKVCNESIMNTFFQLIREKNPDIRDKVVRILADIYDKYLSQVSNDTAVDFGNLDSEHVLKLEDLIVSGIPNHLLQLNYINEKSITTAVDIALFEKLLPFDNDSTRRADRLCRFYSVLDERSKSTFIAITKRQQRYVEVLQKYVLFAEEYFSALVLSNDNKENASDSKMAKVELITKVDKIIQWLTVSFPEGLNSYECIERFLKLKNVRVLNLLKFCISPDLDYKTTKNSIKELLVKLSDPKTIKIDGETTSVTTADMVSNMKILLYRASTIFYNKTNVAELINFSQDPKKHWHHVSSELLDNASSIIPDVFRNHIKKLATMVVGESSEPADPSLTANLLRSIYHFVKKFSDSFPEDQSFTDALSKLAISGSPLAAKYSMKILGRHDKKEYFVGEILSSIIPLDIKSSNFATHLSTIAEAFLIDSLALEGSASDINNTIIEEVLRKNRFEEDHIQTLESWIEDEVLNREYQNHHVLTEKTLAIRLIINRLRSIAECRDSDDQEVLLLAEKPIRLLSLIISNSGEIVKSKPDLLPTPILYQQRLRLFAGLSMLKLAKYPCFNLLIDNNAILRILRLLHDQCQPVREKFLKAVEKNLTANTISERFLHLVFLMGHEPDAVLKNQAITWIISNHKRHEAKKDIAYERILVRLIHTIAHDERFNKFITEQEGQENGLVKAYVYALNYVTIYLDAIAKEENISLLYYFASRVKQYRDATADGELYRSEELPPKVVNLYRVSELCQLMIKELADSRGWNLQTWPGKLNLPSDLYSPMENFEDAQRVISRVYIPDEIQIELRQLLKRSSSHPGVKRKANAQKVAPTVQVKKAKVAKNQAAKVARTKTARSKAIKRRRDLLGDEAPVTRRKSSRATKKVDYGMSDNSENEDEENDEFMSE